MRNAQCVQEFPSFAPTLEVLDVGGNSFQPPASGLSQVVNVTVANTFRLMDVTSMTSDGITLSNINFTCVGTNVTCVVRTGVFTALGTQNLGTTMSAGDEISASVAPATNVPTVISEVDFIDPMATLLDDRRVLVHIMYDFMSVDFSCMYNPILVAVSALDGSSIPSYVSVPAPSWNSTFLPVSATPSTIMLFTGLASATLLFGVNYQFSMVFVYRPVLLNSTGKMGALTRSLSIGTVNPPTCNSALYGVPYTELCIG